VTSHSMRPADRVSFIVFLCIPRRTPHIASMNRSDYDDADTSVYGNIEPSTSRHFIVFQLQCIPFSPLECRAVAPCAVAVKS
jgi:hypothetical protein